MGNPFNKKTEKEFWGQWEEQAKYHKLFLTYVGDDVDFNEKEKLLPELLSRICYLESVFVDFIKICDDKDVALHINATLKPILNPKEFNVNLPEPQVGQQYLQSIKKMIEGSFLEPISKFKNSFPDIKGIDSHNKMIDFLNRARFLFETILHSEHVLFRSHFKGFVSLKNCASGEVIIMEPKEVSLSLYPFITRLNEMVDIAKSSVASIEDWDKKRRERRNVFLSFMAYQAQVRASNAQKKVSVWAIVFQITVIVFTVVLVAATNTANLYMEKQTQSKVIDNLQTENQKLINKIQKLENRSSSNIKHRI